MNINVDISVDFLWGEEHFVKNEWAPITYVVGANGTGKSIVAERLKFSFANEGLRTRYFSAERITTLGSKFDNGGTFSFDRLNEGIDLGKLNNIKITSDQLGQSIDALIELKTKLDLRIKIESVLNDVFQKSVSFIEQGGYLNVKIIESGKTFDLRKNESHGLKEIITLLTFLYDDEYNCIILDEPELNLHPQFQQFILQEIKRLAGDPFQDPSKKMFVILTHSPYMINVQNKDDLKNVIVFHKKKLPSYIHDYTGMDAYQLQRLDRLLLRLNANQKVFFFAMKPVFVEGYIDQQIFTMIQHRRDVPLGALGVSIIDVGGKDEVDIMFSLCRLLGIQAYCIADLDALFEGKLRQTANGISEVNAFMAERGRESLTKAIGEFETLLTAVSKEILAYNATALQGELKQLVDYMNPLTEEKKRRCALAVGIQRIRNEIEAILSEEAKRKIVQLLAIENDILSCMRSVNINILKNGEIEHYYSSPISSPYNISDANKTTYFIQESTVLETMTVEQVETNYAELIGYLDGICDGVQVNTEKMLSKKLGDWIHNVQSVIHSNVAATQSEVLESPDVKWNDYQRIIEIVDFSNSDGMFSCKFKILRNLTSDPEKIHVFNNETVAASFMV